METNQNITEKKTVGEVQTGALETFFYDYQIVKMFAIATILWGVVGMLVGLTAATQLFYPKANFDLQYVTFGRIRPIHTNAIIFAFVGNGVFTAVYWAMQRTLKTRMFSDLLGRLHFWGWQLIIVLAAVTLSLGMTTTKEYAELEWPVDLLVVVVWVIFGINMFRTLIKRREKHMYVAIWFFISTWITVAVLYIFNNLELPATWTKSYSAYAGVEDAMMQWWYGHNAVAFFLTTPILGMMYYFLPKAAGRPVFSYRLSIVHFWTLIFIYIWAGPHHLLYSSLPQWEQTLGTIFSIMLIAPSWGGMLNGFLTLRGVWDKVRRDPILKFMVVAVTAYGMSTFEGPLLSLKNVNALSHFTDWTVAHVHVGGLGWNGFMIFGMLYWLFPRLWNTKLHSTKLANFHFWIGTFGIMFWVVPMYWAGVTQGLMWKQFNEEGFLVYSNFLDTVTQIIPMYMIRAAGGLLYLTGTLTMVYNLIMTAKSGNFVKNVEASAPPLQPETEKDRQKFWHHWIERRPVQFFIYAFIAIAIGSGLELIPAMSINSNVEQIKTVTPYTPLELSGRDIYMREGCNNCHSQQVRPFRSETERYGEYSKAGEYIYDRPFLFGSRRTGPDLHRVGGKYHDSWHYLHMLDPTNTSAGSIMPKYPWLYTQKVDVKGIAPKINTLRILGVPYKHGYEKNGMEKDYMTQANQIVKNLKEYDIEEEPDKEIVALIAYLQKLGSDIKKLEMAEK